MRPCPSCSPTPAAAFGPRRRPRGFTLIEALVAMVIVGILSVFAFNAYQQKIRRGYARAAEGFLMDLAGRQDTYYAKTRRYAADFGPLLGASMSGRKQLFFNETTNLALNTSSVGRRFTIELDNPDPDATGTTARAPSYRLRLSVPPSSVQRGKGECARWTINNLGQRRAEDDDRSGGYVADADNSCWLE